MQQDTGGAAEAEGSDVQRQDGKASCERALVVGEGQDKAGDGAEQAAGRRRGRDPGAKGPADRREKQQRPPERGGVDDRQNRAF